MSKTSDNYLIKSTLFLMLLKPYEKYIEVKTLETLLILKILSYFIIRQNYRINVMSSTSIWIMIDILLTSKLEVKSLLSFSKQKVLF